VSCLREEGSSGTIRVVVSESSLIRKDLTHRMELSRGRQIPIADWRETKSPSFCNQISGMEKKARTFGLMRIRVKPSRRRDRYYYLWLF
jgi:hypothetical protein